jgi:predicted RNA-binding protein with RPS1 domain
VRNFIHTKTEKFDLDNIQSRIEKIRAAFDRYLDSYPVKTAKSKHGIMGPVGKILQDIKRGKWDAPSLSGYALNIHLNNPKVKGMNDLARSALEEGITELLSLLKTVPVTAQDKVLELVDYGLYYERRKKSMIHFEKVKKDWVNFLSEKYQAGQEVAVAWEEKIQNIGENFEKITYPSKRIFSESQGQKRIDLEQFIKEYELKGYQIEEEEDQ